MACTTPAVARISSPHLWGLSSTTQGTKGFPVAQEAAGEEGWRGSGKSWPGVYSESQAQPCWLGMAVVGGCPWLCTAHLASPSLPCRAAQPRRVASIAGEDASLVILFLSAFSHLPPSLGSASRRWVDGRLSGAAASPTASPACLTKPAQRFLPFRAKCFLLRAQVTGKSLVSGIQSILCPQPIVGTGEELAGPHREATFIDALVSKPQAAIHSPAARNHEEISLLISLG